MKKLLGLAMALVLVFGMAACQPANNDDGVFRIVTTTTMLADLARVIGGDQVEVTNLMGPGIDPHLYKASAGDVTAMQQADLVVFNGLQLEGKMGEVFENLESNDQLIVRITAGVKEANLLMDETSGHYDPHIWFNVVLWKEASVNLYEGIVAMDPENEATYKTNYEAYLKELDTLEAYVQERVAEVPETSRVLITAHDAFAYFGDAYGFEVRGLQGISTTSEAGTGDLRDLADYIVEKQIKAIFVESSVPVKNIEALQEAVKAQGFDVKIGGELFSDSLGTPGTEEGTYLGTVYSNVDTIVDALK